MKKNILFFIFSENKKNQLFFVKILRELADGNLEPAEAVKDYHGQLQEAGIPPHRPLEDDLELTQL